MEKNSLSRHYDALTAQERMVLVFNAEARGDHKEVQLLMQSAPRRRMKVLDFHGRASAFEHAISRISTLQLESAGCLLLLLHALKDRSRVDLLHAFYVHVHNYLIGREAWRKFCADVKFSPELIDGALKISTPLIDFTDELLRETSLAKISTFLFDLEGEGAQVTTVEQAAKEIMDAFEKEASEYEPAR